MRDLVSETAKLELLADGFGFLEGPVWHEEGRLFFTDVNRDSIWTWTEGSGAEVWKSPAFHPNGMSRDPDGRLLVCEQETSVLSQYDGRSRGTSRPPPSWDQTARLSRGLPSSARRLGARATSPRDDAP
jgi:sugar lactone lactonase YvrE